jgi:hypothetical protein
MGLPTDSEAASLGAMRVGLAEGDVQVKISETGEWAPVAVNTPLLEGDEIWVPGGSRAALQTNNGADIRLDGGTAFQLLRMDRDSYRFHAAPPQAAPQATPERKKVMPERSREKGTETEKAKEEEEERGGERRNQR